ASPDNFLWSSPALNGNALYTSVASFGDCPLVQGMVVELNAATGAIQNTFDTVPNGCIGGGVWGSPTIDAGDGSVYVVTGNPGCGQSGSLAPSIIKLSASLTLVSSWTVPAAQQSAGDADFGSTPTLFTAVIGGQARLLVGAVNKDGIFYAWDRTNLAAGPVWQTTIATGSGDPFAGSIISAAYDGSRLYVGGGNTTINGSSCQGSIDALDPATGNFLWRSCRSAHVSAGNIAVPGVVVAAVGSALVFLNASNGTQLFSYSVPGQIQGSANVSGGIVYIPVTNGSVVALGQ
ncbi:MAG TPA: PQQ-binding-like beta-propeller repeat protein, partial [Acidimicrobiales bacterium]